MKTDPDIIRLARFRPLPVLPQALEALLALLEASAFNEDGIIDVISREPSLMLQTLRMSPVSPSIGASPMSDHLSRTIRQLGRSGLTLLVSGCLSRHLKRYLQPNFQTAYYRYWHHAVTTAATARQLAEHLPHEDGEIAYLCGLLLGVGHIPLLLEEASNQRENPGSATESHEDNDAPPFQSSIENAVGEALLKHGFPLSLACDVVRYRHHQIDALKTALPIVKIVSIADMIAAGRLGSETAPNEALVQEFIGIDRLEMDRLLVTVAAEIDHVHGMLQISERQTPPANGIDATGHELPPGLIRHLAVGARLQPKKAVFAVDDTWSGAMERLSQALASHFAIHSCIVMHYSPDTHLLGTAYLSAQTDNGAQMLRIPADSDNGVAASWRDNRICEVYADDAGPDTVLADRQIMDLLGTDGMICIPFGSGNPVAGVVIGGVTPAEKIDLTECCEEISQTIADAVNRHHPVAATMSNTARPLSGYAMERLLVKKTSHEIRTPLSIIKNYLSVLQLKMPPGHSAQSELSFIGEEIDRINGLLAQLILPPPDDQHEWVSVNEIVRQIVTVVRAPFPSPAMVSILTDLDDRLPTIYSSRDKIKQIVLNLMKNAVEALSEGGNIHVSTRCGKSTASDALPETVLIVVRDDGPGISDDIRSSIFQPFKSTKTASETGFGLHIVRNAVSAIGGCVTFESAAGQGTSFTIELPVHPRKTDRTPANVSMSLSDEVRFACSSDCTCLDRHRNENDASSGDINGGPRSHSN